MTGGDPEYALTYEQAVAMLPDGERVHTFLDGGLALIGADWPRQDVLILLASGRPEVSGDVATSMGHGLVAFRGDDPVFIATKARMDGEDDDSVEPPRTETDCHCANGGQDCPCEADGDDGMCACCRSGDHRGSCAAPGNVSSDG